METKKALLKILEKNLHISEEEILKADSLNDFSLPSLDRILNLSDIEDTFNVDIPYEDNEKLMIIDAAVKYIETKIAEKNK